MSTREDIVQEFHSAFGSAISQPLSPELLKLRFNLIREESDELLDEIERIEIGLEDGFSVTEENIGPLLKEMADLQYVLSGLAVTFGLPLEQAFIDVHKSNMTKLGPDGKPIVRDDGKLLKGPNYKEPDMISIAKKWMTEIK